MKDWKRLVLIVLLPTGVATSSFAIHTENPWLGFLGGCMIAIYVLSTNKRVE